MNTVAHRSESDVLLTSRYVSVSFVFVGCDLRGGQQAVALASVQEISVLIHSLTRLTTHSLNSVRSSYKTQWSRQAATRRAEINCSL
jgi:hypothetical protein